MFPLQFHTSVPCMNGGRLASETRMRKAYISGIFLSLLSCGAVLQAQTPAQEKQDNTRVNQRDRNPGEATADQQKENAADRDEKLGRLRKTNLSQLTDTTLKSSSRTES